jgi:hypothetical protein
MGLFRWPEQKDAPQRSLINEGSDAMMWEYLIVELGSPPLMSAMKDKLGREAGSWRPS